MKPASIVPYDTIIVGAGPAGITAAIYLARKKIDILVISLDIGGQAMLSTDVENYTGYTMIPGEELVRRFKHHLEVFNVDVINNKVISIEKKGDLFEVKTENNCYWAKSVIIASGKKPRPLGVHGEDKLIGKGLVYSVIGNAPSFKDKSVVVVGGGNSALQAVLLLSKFTDKIYIVNITPDLTGDEILKDRVIKQKFVKVFNNCKVISIKGDKKVEGVKVMNMISKKTFDLRVDGIIVEIGLVPSMDFKLPNDLKLNERKEIDVDQNCVTNIPGLFAAGDVTDVRWKQIIVAAGEGAKAALSAYDYLMKNKEFLKNKFKD